VIILCFSALVAKEKNKLSHKNTKSLIAMTKVKFIKYQFHV